MHAAKAPDTMAGRRLRPRGAGTRREGPSSEEAGHDGGRKISRMAVALRLGRPAATPGQADQVFSDIELRALTAPGLGAGPLVQW